MSWTRSPNCPSLSAFFPFLTGTTQIEAPTQAILPRDCPDPAASALDMPPPRAGLIVTGASSLPPWQVGVWGLPLPSPEAMAPGKMWAASPPCMVSLWVLLLVCALPVESG